jgi:D-alanyl-D-alanine endopeptidase (penicillin-binding protein 7)
MTAMVLLDCRLPSEEPIAVEEQDVDLLKQSLSHLPVGWVLTRGELLQLALMSSENRAASALARTYPGGAAAFVEAMNAKARALGMVDTRFADPSGLNPENTSTARDLLALVSAATQYDTIRHMTTSPSLTVTSLRSGRSRTFGNSDYLVTLEHWVIGLSKTGFIRESGYCLVLQAFILDRPVLMVLLDSDGKHSRMGDAARVRAWLEESARGKGRSGDTPAARGGSKKGRPATAESPEG